MAHGTNRSPRGRIALLALAAALVYAAATPWLLRPWFTDADALPRSELTLGPMEDTDLYLNQGGSSPGSRAGGDVTGGGIGGNIFHPAANAIAGSENMLAHLR
jgi:hypothetical protein